jgi:hypothetical protein
MPASLHSVSPPRKALSASHPYQKLTIDERVKRILRDTPLFDGHNDLPQQPRAVTHGKIYDQPKFDFEKGFERGMTDIPRLRDGNMIPSFDLNIFTVFDTLKLARPGSHFC